MAGRFSVETVFKAVDKITAPVSRMQNRFSKFTRSMQRGLRRTNDALGSFASSVGRAGRSLAKYTAVGVGAVAGSMGLLLREFTKVENAEAAFTPLLGGADKARQAVQALNDTAASTPFQFETLAKAAGQLLPVMDGDIERTIKTLRMMGDTAGGNAQKLDSITRGFTKAMLKGKVDMESLNMIAEAGVPIFEDLADTMGVKVNSAFFKMISSGRVTTQQLTKAFDKMTSKGGKFYQGMEVASRTTTGLWSTFKDNVSLAAAELGSVLAPTIKDLIKQATKIAQKVREWVKANKELINEKFLEFVESVKDFLKGMVSALNWLKEHGGTLLKVTAGVVALIAALKVLTGVIALVNLVMTANPIGLIIVAIAGLIAAVTAAAFYVAKNWDSIKDKFEALPGPVKAALALLAGPIGVFAAAALTVRKNWEPIKEFFKTLWDDVVAIFYSAIDKVMAVVDRVKNAVSVVKGVASGVADSVAEKASGVADFFGMNGVRNSSRSIVTPADRIAKSVEERRTSSSAEVTIRDETGRAEVTNSTMGSALSLQPTGAF